MQPLYHYKKSSQKIQDQSFNTIAKRMTLNNALAFLNYILLDWSQTHKCATVMWWQTFQHQWEKHVKVINLRSKQLNYCLIEKVRIQCYRVTFPSLTVTFDLCDILWSWCNGKKHFRICLCLHHVCCWVQIKELKAEKKVVENRKHLTACRWRTWIYWGSWKWTGSSLTSK